IFLIIFLYKMMKNMLKKCDLSGETVSFKYKGSSMIKSTIGGILSISIIMFSLYYVIYFGEDIVKKEKPSTRFSKDYTNQSRAYLKEFPVMLYFLDLWANVYKDLKRYVKVEAFMYDTSVVTEDGAYAQMSILQIEKCDPSIHFG